MKLKNKAKKARITSINATERREMEQKELINLAIGHIDNSIRRTITVAGTMGKELKEILPAIKPYIDLQQKVLTDNQLTKEQVGLELITSEEDCLRYWALIKPPKISETELKYRSMTREERQAVERALSLEKDSEDLNTIKKLSLSKKSDTIK